MYCSQENNQLIWQYNGEKLAITPWGENSFRVRVVMMGEILDTDFALLEQPPLAAKIQISGKSASITNGNITAVVDDEGWFPRGRISFYNQKGELLLREVGHHGLLKLYARRFKPIIGGDHRLTVVFESNPDEKLYGMGQYQQEIMDIKGCNFELAHRNTQASVPFVMSSLGYGLLWHNPAIGRACFGKNLTEWHAESTKQLDYWITAGDTPKSLEESYAKATGTVPMMPEYGLGFWQSKLRYSNQEQLLQIAREHKRRNLPIDVIVIDFFHWPKMGDFCFDPEFFPDPQAMMAELKELGIELMISVWPTIGLDSRNFGEMLQKGLLIRPEMGVGISMQFAGDSLFFDATNPESRRYVWEKCKENYYDHGIRIFWLDEAEPEYSVYDYDNYRYKMGTNLQIGNIYPQMYSRTYYDGMKEAGQENIVNLVRCAWAGSQRYGALVWSGDVFSTFEDFRMQICVGLHMGIAGIPWWTTDIGGHLDGDPSEEGFRELLVRWFQFGTFSPVMRLHGSRKPNTPLYHEDGRDALFTGADNEVWSFGDEVYPILEKYMRLRERMRPYVRALMKQASEQGTPVMRTMFYEFPDEALCWDLKDQYMFGEDVLVAPVVQPGATSREVYLPAGADWVDAHSGKAYPGGQKITCEAPIQVIPLFLRDGNQKEIIADFC